MASAVLISLIVKVLHPWYVPDVIGALFPRPGILSPTLPFPALPPFPQLVLAR